MIVEIVERSLKSVKAADGRHRGPDRRLFVIERADNSEPIGRHPLTLSNRRKYGWQTLYEGQFYASSRGPGSRWREVLERAKQVAAEARALPDITHLVAQSAPPNSEEEA